MSLRQGRATLEDEMDSYCDMDVYRKLNCPGGAAAPFTEVTVMPLLMPANPMGSMGYEASQEIVPRALCVCSGHGGRRIRTSSPVVQRPGNPSMLSCHRPLTSSFVCH